MAPCNRRFLLETITFRFHVELGECMMLVAEILKKPARWAQKPVISRVITPLLGQLTTELQVSVIYVYGINGEKKIAAQGSDITHQQRAQ